MTVQNSKSCQRAELKLAALTNALRSCQLFAGMSTPELNAVAEITTVKSVAKGGYLFHEGDPSVGFYIVQAGAINVHRVSARGNLKMQVDFRSVYAAILENWLKVPSEAVLANKYPLLECIA